MFTAEDLCWSCNELYIGQGLNLAQMCFDTVSLFVAWALNHENIPNKYQKKQEKLFFQYMSNSMLFSVPHENNGPLSKCKLFIDSHGILISF